jgi:hypothetical protein
MIANLMNWTNELSVVGLGGFLFACALAGAFFGRLLWLRSSRRSESSETDASSDTQEGYVVSAVLGLLALMLGFTLALAVDRFDTRRGLVLAEANAIETTYLRAQLLAEPHRARLSQLLVAYTDTRIALAGASRREVPPLLAQNDRLLTDLWTATSAAFATVAQLDFSTSLLESANQVINLDIARKASRLAHVPAAILIMLSVYIVATAGVLGYVLKGVRGQFAGAFLITLLTLLLVVIIDLERPTAGGIRESQVPMQLLQTSLKNHDAQLSARDAK